MHSESRRTLFQEPVKRRNRILIVLAVILLFAAADGTKSYLVARRYVSTKYPGATNVRFSHLYFVGVWRVAFRIDAWHKDAWITVTVAPLLPKALGRTTCR